MEQDNKVKKIKKSKQMNVINIDLEQKEVKEIKPIESFINNIDLLYLTNQVQYAKTNKLENLLNNNSLLKEIFDNLEDNINLHKEQILKYNNSTLEKLLANTSNTSTTTNTNINTNINEKYKMYYLLYVLNLILHLKEKKMKNIIKEELKDYSNSSYNDQTVGDFNITNETINCMCPTDTSKKIQNLDLFVVRKSNKYNKKILPQKRE